MKMDKEKRFQQKHGHFTIRAVYEGDYVRWSKEEPGELEDAKVSTIKEFEKMIKEEEWREI